MLRITRLFLKLSISTIALLCIIECRNATKTNNTNEYQLKIGIDASLEPIAAEIINLFNYYNPALILHPHYNKTEVIKRNFNNNFYDLIIIPKQKNYSWDKLTTLNIYPKEEVLFQDALVFITSPKNSLNNIDIKHLNRQSTKFNKLIFDSNINTHYYKYLVELNHGLQYNTKSYSATLNPENLSVYLNTNDLIITNIAQILNNTKIQNNVKILAINSKEHSEQYMLPSQENLINKKYPLGIEVVAIYKDTSPYLSRSFIDFSLGQIGQLAISKYGLIPRKIYKRVIEINDKPLK